MTLQEIRREGIKVLARHLGPVNMARFLLQFGEGSGDYTRERRHWLNGLTIQQVVEVIYQQRKREESG